MLLFNTDKPLTSCKKSDRFNERISRKVKKTQILGKFGPRYTEKDSFTKIGLRYFLRLITTYLHAKKSEKTNDPVLRKAVDKKKTDAQTHARTDTGEFIGPYLW